MKRHREFPAPAAHLLLLSVAFSIGCETAPGDAADTSANSGVAQEVSLLPDSTRLVTDLAFLAHDDRGGRGAGSEGNREAREYIVAAYEAAGLTPFRDDFRVPFEIRRLEAEAIEGVNAIGFVRGTEHPDRFIVVSAHFDHLGTRDGDVFNGADDNASGTSALMEMARMTAEAPLRHSILFAAFDAEEMGLRGARAFVESPPIPLENVVLNLNMDMISRNDSVLYAAGTRHYPALREILEPIVGEVPVVLRFGHDEPGTGSNDWTSASDHGPFHAEGIPFVYFGVEDHPDYHRPTDDVERVDPGFYVASVQTIWRSLIELDRRLDPEEPTPR